MSALRAVFARLAAFLRKHHALHLDEELEHHAELLAADYVRRGMSEADARYAAKRELGNITLLQEDFHEQSTLPMLENFLLDLRFSLRTLSRNPVFAATCTATLALGLGSMITVFSFLDALLWKPLPYPNPNQLVAIKEVDPRGGLWTFSEPTLLDLEERSQSLSAVAAYRPETLALTGIGDPETVQAAALTPSSFALLGMKPLAGRFFDSTTTTAVISRALWRRKWQMSPRSLVSQSR